MGLNIFTQNSPSQGRNLGLTSDLFQSRSTARLDPLNPTPYTLSHTLALSLALTHTHSLSRTHTLSHSRSHTLTLSSRDEDGFLNFTVDVTEEASGLVVPAKVSGERACVCVCDRESECVFVCVCVCV